MSKGRLVSCYVLSAAALLATAWFAIASFPLQASRQTQVQQGVADGISQAFSTRQGPVNISVTDLTEPLRSNLRARLVGFQGRLYTMELRDEILKAAREVDPAARLSRMSQVEMVDGSLVHTLFVTVGPGESAPANFFPPLSALQAPVQIDVSNLPEPPRSTMQVRLAPFEGQPYTLELQAKITKAAWEVDQRAFLGLRAQPATEVGPARVTILIVTSRPGPQVTSPLPPTTGRRIPVGGTAQAARLLQSSLPEYPPLARQARIQGTVRFNAVIDTAGHVANITLVSGHPLLVPAAQAVVKEYVYQPTLLNGEPVEVVTQIDVNFTLQ